MQWVFVWLADYHFHRVYNTRGSLQDLEKRFGETFLQWYPKLKDEKLIKKAKQVNECNYFFPDLFQVPYDEIAWSEFSSFMSAYNAENKDASI